MIKALFVDRKSPTRGGVRSHRERVALPPKGDSHAPRHEQSELLVAVAGALRSPLRRIALDVLFPGRREREPRDPGQLTSEEAGWDRLPRAVL